MPAEQAERSGEGRGYTRKGGVSRNPTKKAKNV
jgi:hypothetical protein